MLAVHDERVACMQREAAAAAAAAAGSPRVLLEANANARPRSARPTVAQLRALEVGKGGAGEGGGEDGEKAGQAEGVGVVAGGGAGGD
eukprot:5329317-Prymnesium_polylepis.1